MGESSTQCIFMNVSIYIDTNMYVPLYMLNNSFRVRVLMREREIEEVGRRYKCREREEEDAKQENAKLRKHSLWGERSKLKNGGREEYMMCYWVSCERDSQGRKRFLASLDGDFGKL